MLARPFSRTVIALLAFGATSLLGGCVTFQPMEIVLSPPSNYQLDTATKVEFAHPTVVGMRCAERGAKFLGLPGINSGACSDENLMTMPDPCLTFTGGPYAGYLCRELETLEIRKETSKPDSRPSPKASSAAQLTRIGYKPSQSKSITAATASTKVAAGVAASPVEFVKPDQLAFRCAERGAKLMRDPTGNWGACSDGVMLTVANPCYVEFDGWYARMLCHEMGHANGWAANHSGGTMHRQMPLRPLSEAPGATVVPAVLHGDHHDEGHLATVAAAAVSPAIPTITVETMSEQPALIAQAAVSPAVSIDAKPQQLDQKMLARNLMSLTNDLLGQARLIALSVGKSWARVAVELR